MSPPKSVKEMSPEEMRAELVSLLADGVLRYLPKRKVDRGHHQPQFSAESVEGAIEVSSKPRLSVTNPVIRVLLETALHIRLSVAKLSDG
jgi:hypothetical protein